MTISVFSLYVYDRRGTCIFFNEWTDAIDAAACSKDVETQTQTQSRQRPDIFLVFGLLFELKTLADKLSPTEMKEGLQSFSTDKYTLHHFQTATGLRFVLNTPPSDLRAKREARAALIHIYTDLYINHVVKNPLHVPGSVVECPVFKEHVNSYILGLR
jgi:hypothetical protein